MTHPFTCKTCGSHEVMVSGMYTILEEFTKILPCDCGKSPDGKAVIREYFVEKIYEDYGLLDQEHRWEPINRNKLIDRKEEDKDFQLNCGKCFLSYDLDNPKWTTILENREMLEESVEFLVSCEGCGREMEFGWSQPERSGYIWPVEWNDFNHSLVWPEPRYREKWQQRGWLKKELMFDIFLYETRLDLLLQKIRLKRPVYANIC